MRFWTARTRRRLLAAMGSGAVLLASAAASAAPSADVGSESPRAALSAYFDLCRSGRYEQAAQYLALAPEQSARGAELSRRLKAVLDRNLWFDLADVSADAQGDLEDGLPANSEELGKIPLRAGAALPVRLTRIEDAHGARWMFSAPTVSRIDDWYARLQNRWLIEHLPDALLQPGPFDVSWWQWLTLPLVFTLAWIAGVVLGRLTRAALTPLVKRTAVQWDDAILARVGPPLALAWMLAVAAALLPWLGLYAPADHFTRQMLRLGALVALFWALLRCIDMVVSVTEASAWGKTHPASGALLVLAGRAGKFAVAAMAAVAVLSTLGYPVASLLAGLGLGGLAFALAAQKTVENLFGAFSISVDQPFRPGDFVRVDDFVGTVEQIGLRSTRIRTLDRTLISIPNGKLADMRLESFAARDRIRLACTLSVEYGTTAAQMHSIITQVERTLRDHPKVWPDAVVVFFSRFAESSLDIDVMAWFQTADWNEFQAIRQEILLSFMHIVEDAGSAFAFPTRTMQVVQAASVNRGR